MECNYANSSSSSTAISKDGNGGVIVREFAVGVLLTFPSQGRVEDEIKKFSRTLTPKIPTLVISYAQTQLPTFMRNPNGKGEGKQIPTAGPKPSGFIAGDCEINLKQFF